MLEEQMGNNQKKEIIVLAACTVFKPYNLTDFIRMFKLIYLNILFICNGFLCTLLNPLKHFYMKLP